MMPHTDHKRVRRAKRDLSTHFVYQAFDQYGDLLYVGCSSRPGQRLAQHALTAEWWPLVHNLTMEAYPNRWAGLDAELHLIHTLDPQYNVVGMTREQLADRA